MATKLDDSELIDHMMGVSVIEAIGKMRDTMIDLAVLNSVFISIIVDKGLTTVEEIERIKQQHTASADQLIAATKEKMRAEFIAEHHDALERLKQRFSIMQKLGISPEFFTQ